MNLNETSVSRGYLLESKRADSSGVSLCNVNSAVNDESRRRRRRRRI